MMLFHTCQWIGPDKDPIRDHENLFTCGSAVIPGKAYCQEHYSRVYIGGSAVKSARAINRLIPADPYVIPAAKEEDGEPKELEFHV
jgi:hypothetical protein